MNKYVMSALSFILFTTAASAGKITYGISGLNTTEGKKVISLAFRLDVAAQHFTHSLEKKDGFASIVVPSGIYDRIFLVIKKEGHPPKLLECISAEQKPLYHIDLTGDKIIELATYPVSDPNAFCEESGG